jgi:catechol 2,3-dioxygenase-like lactoylglutathione lyase family enzyme
MTDAHLFEQLDFIYMASADVAAEVRYFTEVLGARLTFAIEGMGTRVAMLELAAGPPRVLLAGHLDGERPVLVYRVADLDEAMKQLESRGWARGTTLEIPHGPVCSFATPGGHRIAIYQLTRPEVAEHFTGRRDF